MKTCPRCSTVHDNYITKCDFCGYNFNTGEVEKRVGNSRNISRENNLNSSYHHVPGSQFNTLSGYGQILSAIGWIIVFIGAISFLTGLGHVRSWGMFGILGGILTAAMGFIQVASGQVISCFVSIEKYTRGTYELLQSQTSMTPSNKFAQGQDTREKITIAAPSTSTHTTEKELEQLKRSAGEDAIHFAYTTDTEWVCVCGTHNPLDRNKKIQNCSNCGRNRDYVLNKMKAMTNVSRANSPEKDNASKPTKEDDSIQEDDHNPILTDMTQTISQENPGEDFSLPRTEEYSLSQTYFRLVFSGKIQSDKNLEEVKTKLIELYDHKYDMSQMDRLFFSGKPVVIKSNLNYQEAMRLQKRLTDRIGGVFTIEAMEQKN